MQEKKVETGLKLVLKGPEERVVGLHCIGPHSDEMMQGFAVAVRMGATRADFEASVAIHPTISEDRNAQPALAVLSETTISPLFPTYQL